MDKETDGQPPQELFHYTGVDGLLGILRTKTLLATHAQFSNDWEEMTHGLDLIQARVEELVKSLPEGDIKTRFQELISHGPKILKSAAPYIFCLSKNGDQLSQWRAYANPGYSIGFITREVKQMTFANNAHMVPALYQVLYTPKEKDEIAAYALNLILDFLKNAPAQGLDVVIRASYNMVCRFKNEGFREEEEWRLVYPADASQEGNLKFRGRAGIPIPSHVIRAKDGKLPLSQIIVGPHPHQKQAVKGVQILLRSLGYGGQVPVYSPKIPFRSL